MALKVLGPNNMRYIGCFVIAEALVNKHKGKKVNTKWDTC